jgi:hypothetical protein
VQLKKRTQHIGEFLQRFATAIDHLSHHAHIDLPEQNISREAIRAFTDGVRDREIRCHLLVTHKKTFSESFPSGPLWFDFPNNIWWSVKFIKLLIMELRWMGKKLPREDNKVVNSQLWCVKTQGTKGTEDCCKGEVAQTEMYHPFKSFIIIVNCKVSLMPILSQKEFSLQNYFNVLVINIQYPNVANGCVNSATFLLLLSMSKWGITCIWWCWSSSSRAVQLSFAWCKPKLRFETSFIFSLY